MRFFRAVPGAAFTAAAVAGVVWASHAPMAAYQRPDGLLRLAWSARPERIETCRQLSEEELAKLPQHMRQPVECVGAAAHYRLTVRADGRTITSRLVHAGGLRQDRRVYVFEEIALPAGEMTVDVSFERVESGSPDDSRVHPAASSGLEFESVPPRLDFTRRITVLPRTVFLVTYDEERRALEAVQGSTGTVDQTNAR
jgi:hypothetical protein